jgi:hypothetical protein
MSEHIIHSITVHMQMVGFIFRGGDDKSLDRNSLVGRKLPPTPCCLLAAETAGVAMRRIETRDGSVTGSLLGPIAGEEH